MHSQRDLFVLLAIEEALHEAQVTEAEHSQRCERAHSDLLAPHRDTALRGHETESLCVCVCLCLRVHVRAV